MAKKPAHRVIDGGERQCEQRLHGDWFSQRNGPQSSAVDPPSVKREPTATSAPSAPPSAVLESFPADD